MQGERGGGGGGLSVGRRLLTLLAKQYFLVLHFTVSFGDHNNKLAH